nr:putative late blight resistance protein homolog R1B-16 [Ipomoea trifida]
MLPSKRARGVLTLSQELKIEAEIRDAAFEAEERIEMELTTIYLAKGWTKSLACLRLHGIFIQAVIQTDYLKKKFIKISEKQLAKLEKLSIRKWHSLNRIPCSGISWATSFLPNLKKLKFMDTNLPWNAMWLIGMLPNLEVLKLICAIALDDRMWEPSKEGFRQLKRLVIEDTILERWNAVGDNFPVLECLELRHCLSLQEIPSGFSDITTLALIQLSWCLDSVWLQQMMSSEAMEMIASVFVPNILLCGKLEIHHQWQRRDLYRACHYTFDRSESTLPKYLAEAVAIRDVLSWVKTREVSREASSGNRCTVGGLSLSNDNDESSFYLILANIKFPHTFVSFSKRSANRTVHVLAWS